MTAEIIVNTCKANPAGFIDGVTVGVVTCVLLGFYLLRKHYK